MGQLVSDIVLPLLSWMVEEERQLIRTAQHEGIKNAKIEGDFKGGMKKIMLGQLERIKSFMI
jgi:DNA invertase Pin-like site-specific DNA recombinase